MTPRERLKAAVDGHPVDRVPFVAWHHFYLDPAAGPDSPMADAELRFYQSFEPDLLKVMHDIPYEPTKEIVTPDDWRSLTVLKPTEGNFAKQISTLRQIRAGLDSNVPMIETVFGVYHYANEISGGKLLEHLREAPEVVNIGLAAITESLRRYAKAAIDAGCEGIYYAVSGASSGLASRHEYLAPFKEFDHVVLDTVKKAPFNVLHLHGYEGLYFDLLHDLPANIVCWSDRAGGPSLSEARKIHKGCLMGGINEKDFEDRTPAEILRQGREAIAEAGPVGFILAPGCSVPNNACVQRLKAIGQATCAGQ